MKPEKLLKNCTENAFEVQKGSGIQDIIVSCKSCRKTFFLKNKTNKQTGAANLEVNISKCYTLVNGQRNRTKQKVIQTSYFCGLSREAAGVFLTFKHNVLYKKASIFPVKTSLKKKDRQTDEKWNNFTFD